MIICIYPYIYEWVYEFKIVKDETMSESGVERELTDREVERNIGMNEWF
jgi:hypothetical protein